MKKAVIIPDSFKGTVPSEKICEIISDKIHKFFPACETVSIPVADGGEGSVDCFLNAVGGEKIYKDVSGPFGEKVKAFYAILGDGKTAVIEMAACAGLPLAADRLDPEKTTTYGAGELIIDAAENGCEKIIMCLGGSCTNDLGCGMAAAVGVKFFNEKGESFVPTGGTLSEIKSVDISSKSDKLSSIEFITMCDIDNPLYGESGAAYVFAPQKGADCEAVRRLDTGLRNAAEVIDKAVGRQIDLIPGSGAAGGMGAGMVAFFDSVLQMGIDTVLDTVGFSSVISDADCIFTGEGKMDSQSLRGKVVIGVAKQAKKQNVPVIVIAGDYDKELDSAYENGVSAVFSTNRVAKPFSEIKKDSAENLALTAENIIRLIYSLK